MFQKHSAEVLKAVKLVDDAEFDKIVDILKKVREADRTVYLFGNGGSAATASHMANDLMKMGGLRAFAISGMISTVLAYGNDEGWQYMFSDPVEMVIVSGDCVIGISCSGESKNVLTALGAAADHPGVKRIGISGEGGYMAGMKLDALITVPGFDITVQEDVHLMIGHALARKLCDESATV